MVIRNTTLIIDEARRSRQEQRRIERIGCASVDNEREGTIAASKGCACDLTDVCQFSAEDKVPVDGTVSTGLGEIENLRGAERTVDNGQISCATQPKRPLQRVLRIYSWHREGRISWTRE